MNKLILALGALSLVVGMVGCAGQRGYCVDGSCPPAFAASACDPCCDPCGNEKAACPKSIFPCPPWQRGCDCGLGCGRACAAGPCVPPQSYYTVRGPRDFLLNDYSAYPIGP